MVPSPYTGPSFELYGLVIDQRCRIPGNPGKLSDEGPRQNPNPRHTIAGLS